MKERNLEAELTMAERRLADYVARTWADDSPDITESTYAAAEALGMGAGEVWRILEVWQQCAAKSAIERLIRREITTAKEY